MSAQKQKVIVIVGPTASGKTSLAIRIAKEFGGEIVSADSRQVYRGLDIGSGKVTTAEMDGISHHMLDVADPNETYTAADFVHDGRAAIDGILTRKKLPIIAGGTFFYVDALLGRITPPSVAPDQELRDELEKLSEDELFARLQAHDPRRAADIDRHNKRRLVRALEIVDSLGSVPEKLSDEVYDPYIVGIDIEKGTLHENIHIRLLERLAGGMVEEVRSLHDSGVSWERLDAFGLEYRYIARYLHGALQYDKMVALLETEIRKFAKRQMTWLKRDQTIHWFAKDDPKIIETIHVFLEAK